MPISFRIFQFIVIHTVKGFGIVNKAEVDVFLELTWFFHDPMDVGNLILAQQYVNHELPDVQAGFRKGRGTRDQIVSIHWIIKKAREFQKSIYFCFIYYVKAFDCVDHNKLENSERDGHTRPPDLPPEKSACR